MVDYSKLTPVIVASIQEIDMKVIPLSDLSLDTPHTLGSLIKSFVENTTTIFERVFVRNIGSERIETEELCFKNGVCITGEQAQQLLNGVNAPITSGGGGESTSADTPSVPEDPDSIDTDPEQVSGEDIADETLEQPLTEEDSIDEDVTVDDVVEEPESPPAPIEEEAPPAPQVDPVESDPVTDIN